MTTGTDNVSATFGEDKTDYHIKQKKSTDEQTES